VAEIRLPSTLPSLFVGLPRRVEVDAPTVNAALAELESSWPGLRDRLCEGDGVRRHIHVYVDGQRAGLDAPLDPTSRVDVIAAISGG
jgi:sulfur-carrier protein